jgi:hypothetical protein
LKAYVRLDKEEDGYLLKKKLFDEVERVTGKKQAIIYRNFKSISADFDIRKEGKTVYIKLKGE